MRKHTSIPDSALGEARYLSAAAFALLFYFFLGGFRQLIKPAKIVRVGVGQVLADFRQGGRRCYLDDLDHIGLFLPPVRAKLGYHPAVDCRVTSAFANAQMLGAWNGGGCVF